MKKGFRVYKVGLLLISFMIFSGVFLFNTNTFADDTVIDTVRITVPSSCSLTSGLSGDGNYYQVNMLPGQYKNDIGPSTFSVFCNNNEGFSIYAIGFSDNEYGNTKMLSSDPDVYIQTGTNTSGAPSSWAMKMTAVTGSGEGSYTPTIVSPYNNFAVVPATYTKVATVTSSITSNTEASVEATYAIYVTPDQIADTYTGKVKYTVVNPATNIPNEPKDCNANTICYWPNAGNTVVDSMGDQEYTGYTATVSDFTTPLSNGGEATLWASNFQRPGYGFVGWSDKFDWELNANDASGNGTGANAGYHIYGPNATVILPSDIETKGLSLYAVWAPSAGVLQGYTCPDNTAMPIGKVTALTDLRDNDTYAVAKLADGKCWMIENLRLDYDAAHNSDGSLAQGYGGVFVGLAEPEATYDVFHDVSTANSLYYSGTQSGTASVDIGTTGHPGVRMPRYRNDNTASPITNMTSANENIYSYGNYYNWAAAKANTDYLDTEENSNAVNTSLCPSGWHLPFGSGSGEFGNLSNSLGGYKDANDVAQLMNASTIPTGAEMSKVFRGFPNNYVYSGYIFDNSVSAYIGGLGYSGRYFSATGGRQLVNDDQNLNAYILNFSRTGLGPGSQRIQKHFGFSIRCVNS